MKQRDAPIAHGSPVKMIQIIVLKIIVLKEMPFPKRRFEQWLHLADPGVLAPAQRADRVLAATIGLAAVHARFQRLELSGHIDPPANGAREDAHGLVVGAGDASTRHESANVFEEACRKQKYQRAHELLCRPKQVPVSKPLSTK